MKTTSTSVQRLTKLALLLAIELAMRAIGLDSIMIGPLKMSFLTLPIAVAAMLCGPLESMALGAVFGILSLTDAITGRSPMTGTFFALSPVHTVILCVGMRMLMGLCCGSRGLFAQNFASVHIGHQPVQGDRAVFCQYSMGADGNLAAAVQSQQKGAFCLDAGAGGTVIEPGKELKRARIIAAALNAKGTLSHGRDKVLRIKLRHMGGRKAEAP